MTNLRQFKNICCEIMRVQKPVRMKVVRKLPAHIDWEGWAEETKRFHRMIVFRPTSHGVREVIAHEVVHFAVFERYKGVYKRDHGIEFQRLCYRLEIALRRRGLRVGRLYSRETDVD